MNKDGKLPTDGTLPGLQSHTSNIEWKEVKIGGRK